MYDVVWCQNMWYSHDVYIHNAGWIIISHQQRLESLEPIQLLAHGTCYRRREKFSDSRGFDTDRMAGGPRGPWLKGKHTNPGNWSNLKQFTHENLSRFLSSFSHCRGLASDFCHMTCSKCSVGFFLVAGKKQVNLRSTWTYSRQGIVSKFFGHHPEAVKEDELSYVIGKEAATQKKIEKVCPCMCSNFGMCMVIYRVRGQMSQWRSLDRSLSQQFIPCFASIRV